MSDRYWDTVCFLGVLNAEPDKLSACRAVIAEAERGNVRVVTSALTIAEVLWPKGSPLSLGRDKLRRVQTFMQHEWIAVRDVDRTVAEEARELVWDHNVRPKDAIHVATALDAGVEQFDTFDGDLIALSGQIGKSAARHRAAQPAGAAVLTDQPNLLYYGDNLDVLRRHARRNPVDRGGVVAA
ncbi:MAG: type II toxin-antitoxin system VapC family toxin [Thermoleophilia bacterium]|nr:type II toxin-antitoxin system VapC family toxin [Thermoleophilia bacterium]